MSFILREIHAMLNQTIRNSHLTFGCADVTCTMQQQTREDIWAVLTVVEMRHIVLLKKISMHLREPST